MTATHKAESVNYVAHVLVRVSVSCPDSGPGMEFGPGSIPVCFNPPVRR